MMAILLLTGCSTTRTVSSDSINTEGVRTVTGTPMKILIGEQSYSLWLSATDNGKATTWELLLDSQYKPVGDGLILLRFSEGYVEELKANHKGRLGLETEHYMMDDGREFERTAGWRATYPLSEKILNCFENRSLEKIRVRSPQGYEESSAKPSDSTSDIGIYIANTKKAILKRMAVRHDELIYKNF